MPGPAPKDDRRLARRGKGQPELGSTPAAPGVHALARFPEPAPIRLDGPPARTCPAPAASSSTAARGTASLTTAFWTPASRTPASPATASRATASRATVTHMGSPNSVKSAVQSYPSEPFGQEQHHHPSFPRTCAACAERIGIAERLRSFSRPPLRAIGVSQRSCGPPFATTPTLSGLFKPRGNRGCAETWLGALRPVDGRAAFKSEIEQRPASYRCRESGRRSFTRTGRAHDGVAKCPLHDPHDAHLTGLGPLVSRLPDDNQRAPRTPNRHGPARARPALSASPRRHFFFRSVRSSGSSTQSPPETLSGDCRAHDVWLLSMPVGFERCRHDDCSRSACNIGMKGTLCRP
jgi:hypothetical protein